MVVRNRDVSHKHSTFGGLLRGSDQQPVQRVKRLNSKMDEQAHSQTDTHTAMITTRFAAYAYAKYNNTGLWCTDPMLSFSSTAH